MQKARALAKSMLRQDKIQEEEIGMQNIDIKQEFDATIFMIILN